MQQTSPKLTRRVALGGGVGLLIGMRLPIGEAQPLASRALNAWVRIGADNSVTLRLSQCEIGQGISTSLPAILADELGADFARVRVENAPVAAAYQNPRLRWMFTGNSESIQTFAPVMRLAGAQAREVLVQAAAARWGVAPAACRTEAGMVYGPAGRSLTFGALAEAAAQLPLPADPPLRASGQLRLIGRALPRRDVPAKVDGSAVFGLDVKLPGMLIGVPRLAPVFGGRVTRVDPASVTQRPGVRGVVAVPGGVVVVADHYWQARQAAEALDITFEDGTHASVDSAGLDAQHRAAMEGTAWRRVSLHGDAREAAREGTRTIEREYASPFQAHATMEPMNCTARVSDGLCEVWVPTQGPQATQLAAAAASGLAPDQVRVHWTHAGGGFGRRLLGDFVVQAVLAARTVGRPVKVIWPREEDFAHDFYRPGTLTRLTASLDAQGTPRSVRARHVSATQLQPVSPAPLPPHVDPRVTEGLEGSRYRIAHWQLDYHKPSIGVPTSVLRTTGFGPNIFALESFVDELAAEARMDPLAYRRALLSHDARALRVLARAAEAADWGTPLPAGRARGIAFCDAFETLIAQVVELSVAADRTIRLHRVMTVADPGQVFDPGIAAANLEGGVVWGLSSALKGEMTFAQGRAAALNFDDYDVLRLAETPAIETHLLESAGELVGGLGEVGPVCVPPALVNAVFAATGERLRSIPLTRHGYTLAS